MSETKPPRNTPSEPSKGGAGRPDAGIAGKLPPPAGAEFDFAIEEITPNERLKEGFTGQER